MHSVVKGRNWWELIIAARQVLLVWVVAVSCLCVRAADVYGQSIVGPGEGRVLQVLGQTLTVKLDGEQTEGRYAVIEEVSPVGSGPPLHVH
jgi:hypothetical protein